MGQEITAVSVDEQEVGSEVIASGLGETQHVPEVGAKGLLLLAPGTSPLKAIEKLPRANF